MRDKLNSIPEACSRLRIAKVTLYQAIHRGIVGCVHVGRRVFVLDSEIERIIQAGTTPARVAAPQVATDFKMAAAGDRD